MIVAVELWDMISWQHPVPAQMVAEEDTVAEAAVRNIAVPYHMNAGDLLASVPGSEVDMMVVIAMDLADLEQLLVSKSC